MTGVLSTPAFTGPQRVLTIAWWRQTSDAPTTQSPSAAHQRELERHGFRV